MFKQEDLGMFLRLKREDLGKTLKQMSQQTSMSQSYLCRLENQKRTNISLDFFVKIINGYNLTLEEVLMILNIKIE